VLVAAIIAALATTGVAATLGEAIKEGVCAVAGNCEGDGAPEADEDPPTATVDPQLSSGERSELLGDPRDAQDVLASLTPEEKAWIEQNDLELAEGLEAAIDWVESEELVSRYADAPLEDYLAYRDSADRDDRLDYTTDECSAPLVGSTGISFDFTAACLRHDFGYRNYKELGLFGERKSDVDRRFLEDMKDHCASRSVPPAALTTGPTPSTAASPPLADPVPSPRLCPRAGVEAVLAGQPLKAQGGLGIRLARRSHRLTGELTKGLLERRVDPLELLLVAGRTLQLAELGETSFAQRPGSGQVAPPLGL
jgi:hypothetical protein